MYPTLLPIHSLVRWLLVVVLAASLIRSLIARFRPVGYGRADEVFRSAASGLSHIQLMLGFLLYFKSPVTGFFRTHTRQALGYADVLFFGIVHISLMTIAVILITIGAAKAKRALPERKHGLVLFWFGIAAILIFLAIPWPFHPLAPRPVFRSF